jgi:NADH:ubiquinone oxidoreductase subunit F (NADH-binding)
MDIINKIKKANLVGRGGGCFSTAVKWGMVKKATGSKKYVICNASEGEPGVKKDGYILENFGEMVIGGMKIAMDFLSDAPHPNPLPRGEGVKGYIFINYEYYKKFGGKLKQIIANDKKYKIELFVKPAGSGYIGGEETSILNALEGKRIEPRLRPPFPTTSGLWNCPTLVNNVETFYDVSLVADGKYKENRFYTISGDCLNSDVYKLPDNWTIEKILKETNNYPKFDFFVQVGGDASGEVLNSNQLNKLAGGAGSITIYDAKKYKPEEMLKKWTGFFMNESCGQCAPCREGAYRLNEIINSDNLDWDLIEELLNNLEEASFCGLGSVVPTPIRSYRRNVLSLYK